MTHTLPSADQPRELLHRDGDGLDVTLLWRPAANDLAVVVLDARNGIALELPVGDAPPVDVFHHPFFYAASRGIEYATAERDADADRHVPTAQAA